MCRKYSPNSKSKSWTTIRHTFRSPSSTFRPKNNTNSSEDTLSKATGLKTSMFKRASISFTLKKCFSSSTATWTTSNESSTSIKSKTITFSHGLTNSAINFLTLNSALKQLSNLSSTSTNNRPKSLNANSPKPSSPATMKILFLASSDKTNAHF